MKKVTCENGHVLKRATPKFATITCDYCLKNNIAQENAFYCKCDYDCDFDICPCCYIMVLSGQKEVLIQRRQKILAQKKRQEAN